MDSRSALNPTNHDASDAAHETMREEEIVTLLSLLGVVRRCWWVVLIGVGLSTGLAAGVRPQSVATASVDVLFTLPKDENLPNSLVGITPALIATAGIVADDLNGPGGDARTVGGVSLVDQGIYDGWSISLPNDGGQWENNYDSPLLRVETTASTPEQALSKIQGLINQITTQLTTREEAAHVSPANMIRLRNNPTSPAVTIGAGRSSQARAVLLLVGLGLSLVIAAFVDRRRSRRVARFPRQPRHRRDAQDLTETRPLVSSAK